MTNTIEALKIRIHKLQQKDPIVNNAIIRKLQRRVRALEAKYIPGAGLTTRCHFSYLTNTKCVLY